MYINYDPFYWYERELDKEYEETYGKEENDNSYSNTRNANNADTNK